MALVPYVIEQSSRGERSFDIYSRLLEDRIVMLNEEVNSASASVVGAQLLYLESKYPTKDISLYINSPGGVVTAGMAIYDTMQYIRPDVSTICIGSCASMAAVLLTAGEKGKRYALPHASVMIHQPLGGAQGQATDIAIHAKEIIRLRSELNGIIAAHSGQTLKTVMKDTERDNFMTADAALKYGLIDKILTRNELAELNGKSELSKK